MLLADLALVFVALVIFAMLLTVFMHAILKVPYVPTSQWIGREMVKAAHLKAGDVVYDLGAGDGRVLMLAKKMHPGIHAVGCEIVPTVWLMGMIRRFLKRSDVTLHLRSAFDQDLRDADVLLLYMTADFLATLRPKLEKELRPGTRIVSHAFHLPGLEPKERIELKNGWRRAVLNVYEWPRI